MSRCPVAVACVLGTLALSTAPAQAAAIPVNTTTDEFNTGTGCSLREAIQAANTDSAFGGCPAGSSADTINLQPNSTYAESISNGLNPPEDANAKGDFDISGDLTIQGAGAGSTTIDGASFDRVLQIFPSVTVVINGVTIKGGRPPAQFGGTISGGGIQNAGTLTLNNDDVIGNFTDSQIGGGGGAGGDGGGLFNSGSLTLNGTTVETNFAGNARTANNGGSGAGIANEGSGTLTVNGSTIANNVAGEGGTSSMDNGNGGDGGGIYNSSSGAVTISGSTVSGNTAGAAAGIGSGGRGGGAFTSGTGTTTISATTMSGNKAGKGLSSGNGGAGGGLWLGGTLVLANSTVASNTGGDSNTGARGAAGGLYVGGGSATLTNDTVAGNAEGSGGGLFNNGGLELASGSMTVANSVVASNTGGNCSGSITDGHHNVSFEPSPTCPAGFATGNPNLGPLQDNGGPTKTMSVAGPSAVDQVPAIGANCPAADQRGIPRPQGTACDIGAFEVVNPTALSVTKVGTGTGSVTSSPAGIDCGATCSASFVQHATVTLTAAPDTNSTFDGWSGGGCSGTGTCTGTLDAATTVTATFDLKPSLSVSKTGTGTGAVTSSPAGIDCGATCSAQFDPGTSVALTATPDAGSTFDGWSGGGCAGTGTCTVAMGADTAVSASFTAIPPPTDNPPNTKISKAKINQDKNTATFKFKAIGGGKAKASHGFQCALVKKHRKPRFRKCTSPKKYKHLKPGKYTFEVRAFDAAGKDKTPAKKKFKINR